MKPDRGEIREALRSLAEASRMQRAAIDELIALGMVETRTLVGDLGEQYAAAWYGVEREPAATRRGKGYDLRLDNEDETLIEVKALRSTPATPRRSIGRVGGKYHLLFAIELDEEFLPRRAMEIRREDVERVYRPGTRVTWTGKLQALACREVTGEELLRASGLTR